MIIEKKAHCTIEYDSKFKCVIQTWEGFAGSQQFRESLLKTVDVFTTHTATSIISDTQHSNVVTEKDLEWGAKEIFPKLIESGLRKVAFIVPQSVFAKWSIEHFTQQTSGEQLTIQYFDDLDTAKSWVTAQGALGIPLQTESSQVLGKLSIKQ